MRGLIGAEVRGMSQIEVLAGLSLGLLVLGLAAQTWGLQRQWLIERDLRQELHDRTPALHRLLLRLSRQAGARPLSLQSGGWQADPPYVALSPGTQLTWVHARGIAAQPANEPNCQNTRVWAKDAAHAPGMIRDQFAWIDGQFKCKDTAQVNARWQTWVEQVRGARVWLAWQYDDVTPVSWRWVAVDETPPRGRALGVRICLSMEAALPQGRRAPPPPDCTERPLPDSGRVWRVWTRAWALRVDSP
jgi:hypothetical protein